MKTYRIASIPGDGIGPEVTAEGIRVLDAVAVMDGGFRFEWTYFPWGCEYYLKEGKMMPEERNIILNALLGLTEIYRDILRSVAKK